MILEPIMMNAGIIQPEPGYLDGLKDLLHAHGALLTFDEVKTGLTAGPGGATALTGVTPDIICLAKAIGGGIAVAAIGGTARGHGPRGQRRLRAGRHLQRQPAGDGRVPGHADRGATPDGLRAAGEAPAAGGRRAWSARSTRNGLRRAGRVGRRQGLRGVLRRPVRNFRDFLDVDDAYSHAHWLFQHNGGVFLPPWGKIEQWLISVQHDEADIDRFIDNFADVCGRGPAVIRLEP